MVSARSMHAAAGHVVTSPPPLPGLTRGDIAGALTPTLTERLQGELASLVVRVAAESPQLTHSVRQISDMVGEVVSRWRRATALAMDAISCLEEELSRRSEQARELSARLADRDAALASGDEARQTLQAALDDALARLEGPGGHPAPLQQAVGSPAAASAGPTSNVAHTQQPQQLRRQGHIASATAATLVERAADDLAIAVASGDPGSAVRVSRFFKTLDAVASTSTSAAHVASQPPTAAPVTAAPAAQTIAPTPAAVNTVDETLRRALAFAGVAPSAVGGSGKVPARQHESPTRGAAPSVATMEVDLDPRLYSRATVGGLRAAVALRCGRRPTRISLHGSGGAPLAPDATPLAAAGVPMHARLELVFAEDLSAEGGGDTAAHAPAGAATATAAPATRGGVAHSPTALPQPAPPPAPKAPLLSPQPHDAPLALTAPPAPPPAAHSPLRHHNAAAAPAQHVAPPTALPRVADTSDARTVADGTPASVPDAVSAVAQVESPAARERSGSLRSRSGSPTSHVSRMSTPEVDGEAAGGDDDDGVGPTPPSAARPAPPASPCEDGADGVQPDGQ